MHPYAMHAIAVFPMTERDYAFRAQWLEKHNASWPYKQTTYGPHYPGEEPWPELVVELNSLSQKCRPYEVAMHLHDTRVLDQYHRARCERMPEEHRTELFAYEWCLKRALTQMARASKEERVELRSRVRRYRGRMRDLREDIQFAEGELTRR